MEIRIVTSDTNTIVLVGGQRVAGPGMTPTPPPAPVNESWPGMDPLYYTAHAGMYFPHGPAVGVNSEGQPIDAKGRTAGPKPAPAQESEIAYMIRVGGKHFPGDDFSYDAWGNRLGGEPDVTLEPVYSDESALFMAALNKGYNKAIVLTRADGSQRTAPGFGPPDQYRSQPDGSVVKVN